MPETPAASPAPQFDRATVRAMLDLFVVEGSDFSHNVPNDYGSIQMTLFTDHGDPFQRFAGEQKTSQFLKRVNGQDTYEVRPNGFYRFNDNMVDWLLEQLRRRAQAAANPESAEAAEGGE